MKRLGLVLVTLAVAAAVHLDWHAARPLEHHLSLGLSWHWALAIPVFSLTAWYVHKVWPDRLLAASLIIVIGGAFLGGIAEPLWELWVDRAPMDWGFGAIRNRAFALFTATGIAAHTTMLLVLRRRALPV